MLVSHPNLPCTQYLLTQPPSLRHITWWPTHHLLDEIFAGPPTFIQSHHFVAHLPSLGHNILWPPTRPQTHYFVAHPPFLILQLSYSLHTILDSTKLCFTVERPCRLTHLKPSSTHTHQDVCNYLCMPHYLTTIHFQRTDAEVMYQFGLILAFTVTKHSLDLNTV